MPPGILTGYPGFFGKLPVTGDFVSRGLNPAFIARWDRWVTRHLAARQARDWPEGGLRFSLVSGGRCVAGMIHPSRDGQGRAFPLTIACVLPARPLVDAVDGWCDAVMPGLRLALAGDIGGEELMDLIEAAALPEGEVEEAGTMLLWAEGHPPIPCAVEAPVDALDLLLR